LYAVAIVIQLPVDFEWYSLPAVLSFMGIMYLPLSPEEHFLIVAIEAFFHIPF